MAFLHPDADNTLIDMAMQYCEYMRMTSQCSNQRLQRPTSCTIHTMSLNHMQCRLHAEVDHDEQTLSPDPQLTWHQPPEHLTLPSVIADP